MATIIERKPCGTGSQLVTCVKVLEMELVQIRPSGFCGVAFYFTGFQMGIADGETLAAS